jgi:membrane protein
MAIAVPRHARSELRRIVRRVLEGIAEHDVLTFGSAIAFQILSALAPLLLFGLAALGFLGFQGTWQHHVAPWIASHTSHAVDQVVVQTANHVLSAKRGFWLTGGAVLALWEASGAVRAVMSAFARIYGPGLPRSRIRRYLISFGLAIACGALLIAAALWGFAWTGFGAGWLAAVATLAVRWGGVLAGVTLAVALLVRFSHTGEEPLPWLSFGSTLVVLAWLGTTLVFAVYVSDVANYGSIFGSLAAVFVATAYLYVAACAFLIGALVDAVVREEATGSASAGPRRSRRAGATPRRAR